MKKLTQNIPNAITCIRIIGSAALLTVVWGGRAFLCIYLLCGLSDMLDGLIARKTGTQSDSGAVLDSIADIVFSAVIMFLLLTKARPDAWILYCAGSVVLLKAACLSAGAIRFKKAVFLHTALNKVAGAAAFTAVFIYSLYEHGAILCVPLLIAFLAAVDELTALLLLSTPDRNVRSCLGVLRQRRRAEEKRS